MCCGRILAPSTSPPRWRNTRGGSGGSGHALAETASQWSDLSRRIKTALGLLAIILSCVWVGGVPFLMLVGAACILLAIEWMRMCGQTEFRASTALLIAV